MNAGWEDNVAGEAPPTILVVSREPVTRRALARDLARIGARALEAADAEEALAVLRSETIDGLVADQLLEHGSGIDLLERMREEWSATARVLLCEGDDPHLAAQAVNRAGISYLLPKPWEPQAISDLVARLPERPPSEVRAVRSAAASVPGPTPAQTSRYPGIVGESKPMRELLELVGKVADTDSTALVTGETGTGKELIGRAIHDASRRAGRVFSAVNSAAFPETLLESELFGHRRGAFTGAATNSKGLFEHADKGTVFLDEVAEMPLSMQAKLLRFLQTGEIRPVGGEVTRYVDVRLVTATNKDLETEVAEGRFREDLYYRLAVIPIHVPALRERKDDIPLLADHFLTRMREKTGNPVNEIAPAAMEALMGHRWPGNVRELENVIERAVALCRSHVIEVGDLPQSVREPRREAAPESAIQSLPGLERKHILETLDRVGWNRKRAAALLEISTTTLWRRLKEFGIEGDPRTREQHWTLNG